jgi:hypothetical protein
MPPRATNHQTTGEFSAPLSTNRKPGGNFPPVGLTWRKPPPPHPDEALDGIPVEVLVRGAEDQAVTGMC